SIYESIIEYLNELAGTSYKANSKATIKLIDARMNEKYNLAHFLKVIDNKCAEWKGTDFEKFLRPSTLFGSKFEEYLNQKNNSSSKSQHQAKVPAWMNNQNIKSENMSKEELAELEDLYKDFKQVRLDDSGKLTEGELPF
ncbi:MAG: conserved phage C-terminal domain-containing protein, partial [Bacilli bacterium]|nr:conserved phage C-terminal domain-containing protein [Bacilli bacterium]